jgi:hypothetical protein
VFVDGGRRRYNNPAFLLFKMATEPSYKLGWSTDARLAQTFLEDESGGRPIFGWIEKLKTDPQAGRCRTSRRYRNPAK